MSESGVDGATRPSVLIVGGGLAGLAAAEALARDGRFEVLVVESKRSTGGRAGSFLNRSSGEMVDYCQHVAMGCCTNWIGLLDRCGLGDLVHRYTELQFMHPNYPASRFAASTALPPPLHLLSALGSLRYLTARQKRSVRSAMWKLMRTDPASLASQSAGQWLNDRGQDLETKERFWDVVLVSALGEKTDVVAMDAARKVFLDGFASARGASDVLVPKVTLSELFGQRLPDYLKGLGVGITTGVSVTRLEHTSSGQMRLATSDGQTRIADHVVVAVPWRAAGDLVFQAGVTDIEWRDMPSSPISGIHLWLDREITTRPHAVLVGMLPQWLFRQPLEKESGQNGHYYQVVVSASDERGTPKDALLDRVMDDLGRVFPKAAGSKLLNSRVVTDPHSVFSVTPEVQSQRPAARTSIPCLHLAGDWIATGWPSTMEGAVIGGRMAAQSVLESEGLSDITIDPGLRRGWLARTLIKS